MASSNSHPTFRSVCTIAYLARKKLGVAAEEAEQDLRVLVAHAHLVDDLTEALTDRTAGEDQTLDNWGELVGKLEDSDSDGSDQSTSDEEYEDDEEQEDDKAGKVNLKLVQVAAMKSTCSEQSIPRRATTPKKNEPRALPERKIHSSIPEILESGDLSSQIAAAGTSPKDPQSSLSVVEIDIQVAALTAG